MKNLSLLFLLLFALNSAGNAQTNAFEITFRQIHPDWSGSTTNCSGWLQFWTYGANWPHTASSTAGPLHPGTHDWFSWVCAGVYDLEVVDATGDTVVAEFAVPPSDNVYVDGTTPGSGWDTLYILDDFCGLLDYSLPVDSFFIENAVYDSPDTCSTDWVIYQQGNQINLTVDCWEPSDHGWVSLILWCDDGQRSQEIMELIYADGETLTGTEDKGVQNIMVSPNPIRIGEPLRFSGPSNTSLNLLTIDGKQIPTELANGTMKTDNLVPGIYLLRVETETGVSTQKLVATD